MLLSSPRRSLAVGSFLAVVTRDADKGTKSWGGDLVRSTGQLGAMVATLERQRQQK